MLYSYYFSQLGSYHLFKFNSQKKKLNISNLSKITLKFSIKEPDFEKRSLSFRVWVKIRTIFPTLPYYFSKIPSPQMNGP